MSLAEEATEYIFAYGTLQLEAVQLATFGRRLQGQPDFLVGYKRVMTQIRDPNVVALSGTAQHPTLQLTGSASDLVAGTVFTVTRKELELADAYEIPSEYKRVLGELRSGTQAWVYVKMPQEEG